jgi:hypothetical protein
LTGKHENSLTDAWVIENKIKSSQHSKQLDKYTKIMKSEYIKIEKKQEPDYTYKKLNHHFCYLTLIGEQPQCKETDWASCSYKKLAKLLKDEIKTSNSSKNDVIIIQEYIACIENLTKALETFLKSPKDFSFVFTNGSHKKKTKKEIEEIVDNTTQKFKECARYIAENGLETIFQKQFLYDFLKNIDIFKDINFTVAESHGTALVDFEPQKINELSFGIQFQNGTFKIQVLDNGNKHKDFWDKWNSELNDLRMNDLKDWNFNPPKESQRKENVNHYFSFSKKRITKYWEVSPGEWKHLFCDCEKGIEIIKKHTPSF